MAIVCPACGGWVKPTVQPDRESVQCPTCSHVWPMRILPLFLVTGASGMGKSTVVPAVRRHLPDFDVFDLDLMAGVTDDWERIKCTWLRIAHAIAQSGRGTIICGTFVPENLERCSFLPYFSQIHYLNLHCAPEAQAARLKGRPAWRGWNEENIAQHQGFARWLLEHAESHFDPPLVTIDTTELTVEQTCEQIRDWVLERWPQGEKPVQCQ